MEDQIEILLADDIAETRANIKKLINLEKNLEVVAEAVDGKDVIEQAKEIKPDIILMDINMPKIKGIKATEIITREVPETSIIMMSVQEEQDYLRKAMVAGAREYLIKPFSDDELITAINQVYDLEVERKSSLKQSREETEEAVEEKTISIFSSKGGVGKTLLATNLAVYLQQNKKGDVVLVDLDLQFGDLDVLLDLTPRITIADAVDELDNLNVQNIDDYLLSYENGLQVLASPLRPEEAEMINGEQIKKLLSILSEKFNYVIIDTAQSFSEHILAALDNSELILLIAMLDLSTIRNVRLCLEVMEELEYPEESIKLILNRYSKDIGISIEDLEENLNYSVDIKIPSNGSLTIDSINQGVPFILEEPRAKISKQLIKLTDLVTGEELKPEDKEGWFNKITDFLNN
ncbi:response regulator [Acetohalobium arabaticum]|uniref:Stage 0 sporulation protein A homolog n=1 Tax=Acetohalobium arabaticum (strain ATCC 49924 / DSM 5501 / Z-7288) TaxID=574087 RepID=D9QTM1_ACEAZ|nr:response regulator [Acetohalobium arabaticum]ADL11785.1 response regulator receiver protein [Acetohalobium arabaticum DSM 5501]